MYNLLTDVAGIAVGHATDLSLGSGVTVIVFDTPAVASAITLGGAPGGRDTMSLDPEMTVQRIDAVILSGGSVFGLDAAGGVQAVLRAAGRGLAIGGIHVPLVSQAILFDLVNGGDKDWGVFSPYRDLGHAAMQTLSRGVFRLGSVGAGTGATTATVKGGLGSASAVARTGHVVGAIAAVNAVGTPTIGDQAYFWAAPFERNSEFGGRGWPASLTAHDLDARLKGGRPPETATTIGLVATDAPLTKAQARRLAIMANDGLARAILPAHAPMDGDTVFAASTGLGEPVSDRDLTELGHVATQVMARAIARGVYEATTPPWPGGQRSWRERFGG
jgi:L-aminopeptidase/D-esterase-like protein